MSVAEVPPMSCVSPTAVHTWLAPQDTPLSGLCPAVGLSGVDRRVHDVPFQTSPSVLENAGRWPGTAPAALSYPRRSPGGLTNVPLPREIRT